MVVDCMDQVHLPVRSLSFPVQKIFGQYPSKGRILGIFKRAIDFSIDDQVVALVIPQLKNGPFHIVVDSIPDWNLEGEFSISIDKQLIHIGDWILDFSIAPDIWNPEPDWRKIKISPIILSNARRLVKEKASHRIKSSPFACILLDDRIESACQLCEGIVGCDDDLIRHAVSRIAGYGPGLTPSGDDFLAGVMLALHISNVSHESNFLRTCETIYQSAAARTTKLSRAYLSSASQGQADERWHDFLYSMKEGKIEDLDESLEPILAFGETSGLDMLSGFLWMADISINRHIPPPNPK